MNCPKCYLPLNTDHVHRTYEEHDACRNSTPSPVPPREGAGEVTLLRYPEDIIERLTKRVMELESLDSKAVPISNDCDVCCGDPLPNGKQCICGGTGRSYDEKIGLRKECDRLERELAQLQAVPVGEGEPKPIEEDFNKASELKNLHALSRPQLMNAYRELTAYHHAAMREIVRLRSQEGATDAGR